MSDAHPQRSSANTGDDEIDRDGVSFGAIDDDEVDDDRNPDDVDDDDTPAIRPARPLIDRRADDDREVASDNGATKADD